MKGILAVFAILCLARAVAPESTSKHPCWDALKNSPTILEHGVPVVVGAYTPQCDDNGAYKPKQCNGSTGYCWCALPDGTKVRGTDRSPVQTLEIDCTAIVKEYTDEVQNSKMNGS